MKWLKITVVFFLVTLVKCGPTRSEKDLEPEADAVPPAPIKLERIDRVDDAKFTVSISDNLADTTYLIFLLKDGQTEVPYASEVLTPPSSTFTFNDDISQLSEKKLDFEILAMNDKSAVLGYATQNDFTFPSFPGVLKSQAFTIDDRAPVVTLLRVDGDMGTMGFKDGTKIIDSNYYSFQTTTAKYIPFIDVNSISVFDTELTLDSIIQTPEEDIMTSAILSYQSSNSATIKFSFSDTSPPTVLDVILHATEPDKSTLCNKPNARSLDCPTTGSFPGSGTEKMVIIKRPGKVETLDWSTCNADITDRELIATRLSNNIIEGRWKILDYESTEASTPGNPVYRLRKTSTAGSMAPDDDIEVDCSHLEQTYCFGYFPTLEATETYTLTVAHTKDNKIPGTYNEMQQVESIPQPPKSSEPELAILSRHMTRHANQLTADVNICFQHLTPPEGGAFSHYEMLIINEKGQWLKHRILEEEEGEGEEVSEGRLCFAPFTINTKDFDLTEKTKVVISQRGVDGVTVLATGESKLL